MSITILAPQIRRREHYFMDIFSIIYFSVASICSFIFRMNVFVEYSGFIGYLALSLMAASSIAMKSPFTFRVAKRDWPETLLQDADKRTISSWSLNFSRRQSRGSNNLRYNTRKRHKRLENKGSIETLLGFSQERLK
ncbi:MAG: hypothetical protein QXX94_02725 [Candidatus Bathyarchaeia archaeon]